MDVFRTLLLKQRRDGYWISPVHFQGLSLLVAMLILAGGLHTVYFKAVTPTDQNWFRITPSPILMAVPLPSVPSETDDASLSMLSSNDSTRVGLLLTKIGRTPIRSEEDVLQSLAALPPAAPIDVAFFDPALQQSGTAWIYTNDLTPESYFVLDGTVMVTEVVPNGASDRAGMRKGDIIIQIDNRKFNGPLEAEMIMRNVGPGNTVAYDIMRGIEVQRLYVTLAKYGLPVSVLLTTVFGVLICFAGAFVSIKSAEQKAGRVISGLFLALSFVMLTNARTLTLNDFLDALFLHLNVGARGLIYSFLIVLWFHFPKHRSDLQKHQRWFFPLAFTLPQLMHLPLLMGPAQRGYLLAFEAVFYFAVLGVALFWFVRGSDDLEYKKIGRSLLTLMLLVGVAISLGNREYRDLALVAIPGSILYVSGRYSLLNLDIRIRRNIQYWLVSGSFMAALFILFVAGLRLLTNIPLQLPAIQLTTGFIEILAAGEGSSTVTERSLFMLVGIGVFIGFLRIARTGQQFINRKYHRSNYDYRAANARIHDIVSKNPTVDALNQEISRLMGELMLVRSTCIIVRSPDSGQLFLRIHHTSPVQEMDPSISRFEQLFDYMRDNVSEVRIQNISHPLKLNFLAQGFTIVVPLWSRTRLYGLLLLGEKLSEDTIDQEDITFLNMIAHQLSVAYENAFMYEQLATQERLKLELKLARQIQLSSLPQYVPDIAGLNIAGSSIPAHEVGGDYYDLLTDDEGRLTVIVGDVSGKGTSAALYLSKVQGIIRTLNDFKFGPKELFVRTNTFLHAEIEKKSFVTAVGARFDPKLRQVCIARAGHLPVIHYEALTGKVNLITPRGLGMGMSSRDLFEKQLLEEHISYQLGDVFLFVTDGVTELKNHRGEEFGEETVCAILPALVKYSADKIRDEIFSQLNAFCHNSQPHDDQTLVVVKITC